CCGVVVHSDQPESFVVQRFARHRQQSGFRRTCRRPCRGGRRDPTAMWRHRPQPLSPKHMVTHRLPDGTVTLSSSRQLGESVSEHCYAVLQGHRYPVEIINHCVWLYFRFPLSFREVEELMLERGVAVSYET